MNRAMLFGAAALSASVALGAAPQYTITDLGLADPGDFASQGFGVSNGGIAYGRSVGSVGTAFTWTEGTGFVALASDPTKSYAVAQGANDNGLVVGIGSDTFTGAGAVPLVWSGGSVSQLDIISGLGVGRAYAVNSSGLVVGSNGGGIDETATYWSGGTVHAITATTSGGAYMTTAYAVNDAGLIAGSGFDPNLQSRNVGLLYDTNTGTMMEIPSLAGDNGTIAFAMSENGYVAGTSSFNQSGSNPFIWSSATGTVEIALTSDVSSAIARGVNSDGWVVGIGSGLYAVPFLYDGDETYRLQDLIASGTGWDLSENTYSSALGIAEDGSIVGTGLFNGDIRAFKMTLVPSPASATLLGLGGLAFTRRRR